VQVLTIPSLANTLTAGYPVSIHESADQVLENYSLADDNQSLLST
jgi:hypothetical protein